MIGLFNCEFTTNEIALKTTLRAGPGPKMFRTRRVLHAFLIVWCVSRKKEDRSCNEIHNSGSQFKLIRSNVRGSIEPFRLRSPFLSFRQLRPDS